MLRSCMLTWLLAAADAILLLTRTHVSAQVQAAYRLCRGSSPCVDRAIATAKVVYRHCDGDDATVCAALLRHLVPEEVPLVVRLAEALVDLRDAPEFERGLRALCVDVPVAQRAGYASLAVEIGNCATVCLDPRAAVSIHRHLKSTQSAGRVTTQRVMRCLVSAGPFVSIEARQKTMFSCFLKMRRHNMRHPGEIHDILGIRVVCDDTQSCYSRACLLAQTYTLERWSDYISHPKSNGYRSLHVLVRVEALRVEVQLRTPVMHQCAEHGSAAHAEYKASECLHVAATECTLGRSRGSSAATANLTEEEDP